MSNTPNSSELKAQIVDHAGPAGTVVHFFKQAVGVYFPEAEWSGLVASGDEVTVELSSQENQHRELAQISHMEPSGDGLLCRLEFCDPIGALDRSPVEIAAVFNRRRSQRVPLSQSSDQLTVEILVDGQTDGTKVTLRDISATGMSFRESPDAIELETGQSVAIRLSSPQWEESVTLAGSVRNREANENGTLRYGVRFDFEPDSDAHREAVGRAVQSLIQEATLSF